MWDKLKAPFEDKDLDWRIQQSGVKSDRAWAIILCYVDARAVMDRLDEVVGPENWKDEYEHLDGGVMCKLSLRVDGDDWITKEDGSPETAVEAFKGGISKALVRTAVKWGIGRYLYDMPISFATFVDRKSSETKSAKIDGKYYNWLPPIVNKEKRTTKLTPKNAKKTKVDLTGLMEIINEKGWDIRDVKATMVDMFKKKESKLLTQAEVNGLIDHIKNDVPNLALRS